MLTSALVFSALLLFPALLLSIFFIAAATRPPLIPLIAAQHSLYLLSAPLAYQLSTTHKSQIVIALTIATALNATVWTKLPDLVTEMMARCKSRDAALFLAIGIAVMLPSAFLFTHQGFFADTGRSLFAPGFSGDQLRNANIISALFDQRQSLYFPNSHLIYQIAWHHAAANALGALAWPQYSWLERDLGVSMVTGAVFYATLLWTISILRPRRLSILAMIALGLIACSDADVAGSAWSFLANGHLGISADGSSLLVSPFRYFSIALTTITAPNHASYFIAALLALAFCYRGKLAGDSELPRAPVIAAAFAAVAGVIDPLLFILSSAPIALTVLIFRPLRANLVRLSVYAFSVLISGVLIHRLVFGFSVFELFARPRVTGGGTGNYGIDLFGRLGHFQTLRSFALIPAEALGLVGTLFFLGLIAFAFFDRKRLQDPLPIAWVVGLILWNLVFVETEIQRHFSMIAAVASMLGLGLMIPAPAMSRSRLLMVVPLCVASLAVFLHLNLIARLSSGGSFLPLSVPWREYFCINDFIRSHFPELTVVVRTAEALELPIAAEATSAMVWSQVAFVHQSVDDQNAATFDAINSRDREQFKRVVLSAPDHIRQVLIDLGFKGLVWGPIEEREWGPAVREALTTASDFLGGCNRVALFALKGADVQGRPNSTVAAEGYHKFLAALSDPREYNCDSMSPVEELTSGSEPAGVAPGDEENIAAGKIGKLSTTSSAAIYATDGQIGSKILPVPIARTDGSDPSPYWEIDLDQSRNIDEIRIFSRQDCCADELKDFYVLLSETPFPSRDLEPVCRRPDVKAYHRRGTAAAVTTVRANTRARYVRIQKEDYGILSLAEVEILAKRVDH